MMRHALRVTHHLFLVNVSSMNLSFVDQGVSNSPSWIRGGAAGAAGALILSKIYFEDKSYSSGALPLLRPNGHLPPGGGGVD